MITPGVLIANTLAEESPDTGDSDKHLTSAAPKDSLFVQTYGVVVADEPLPAKKRKRK